MSDCRMAADTLHSFYADAIALKKKIETESRLGAVESAIYDVIAAASKLSAAGAPSEAVEAVFDALALGTNPDKE